jgi:hypothetical protein
MFLDSLPQLFANSGVIEACMGSAVSAAYNALVGRILTLDG